MHVHIVVLGLLRVDFNVILMSPRVAVILSLIACSRAVLGIRFVVIARL